MATNSTIQSKYRYAHVGAGLASHFALLSVGVLCAACGPTKDEEIRFRNYVTEREDAESPFLQTEAAAQYNSELIEMVKNAPHGDGEQTTGEWLQELMDAELSGVMFEDWKVARRERGLSEIRFVYTAMDEQQKIVRHGFSWRVNALLGTVNPPRTLNFSDEEAAAMRPKPVAPLPESQREKFSLE